MMTTREARLDSPLLKGAGVLWVIWGVVHLLAGVMTVSLGTPEAVAGIADGVDPTTLEMAYPAAAGAIIRQHGFNLGWIGLTTMVGGVFVWRGSPVAIFVSALVGGLADVGYFLFIDLGGHNQFVPGTVMTLISGAAVLMSFFVFFQARRSRAARGVS
ncbi:MAG: hypothetical protein AB8I08_12295 [Sandaracinaceae bacterium]